MNDKGIKALLVEELTPTSVLLYAAIIVVAYYNFERSLAFALHEYPIGSRENVLIFFSHLLKTTDYAYKAESLPLYSNLYGIFHHWVLLPFLNSEFDYRQYFVIHRTASQIYIWTAGIVLALYLIKKVRVPIALAIMFGVFWTVQLSSGPTVLIRPGSLGALLYWVALFAPPLFKFSRKSIALCLILTVFGFLTKPFHIIAFPILCAYIFFFRSKLGGVVWGVIGVVFIFISFWLIDIYYPFYFYHVVHLNFHVSGYDATNLTLWLSKLFYYYDFSLIILLASGLFTRLDFSFTVIRLKRIVEFVKETINFRKPREPLFKGELDFIVFYFFAIIPVMLRLSMHRSSVDGYWVVLTTPAICVVICMLLKHSKSVTYIAVALLVVNSHFILHSQRIRIENFSDWSEIEEIISRYDRVFANRHTAHILKALGKPVYDTGHTEYFDFRTRKGGRVMNWLTENKFDKQTIEAGRLMRRHKEKWLGALRRGEFDLLVVEKNFRVDKTRYKLLDKKRLNAVAYETIYFWVKKDAK